jgi:hypothetical protein
MRMLQVHQVGINGSSRTPIACTALWPEPAGAAVFVAPLIQSFGVRDVRSIGALSSPTTVPEINGPVDRPLCRIQDLLRQRRVPGPLVGYDDPVRCR